MAYDQARLEEYRAAMADGRVRLDLSRCPYCSGARDAGVRHVHPSTKPASARDFWENVLLEKFRGVGGVCGAPSGDAAGGAFEVDEATAAELRAATGGGPADAPERRRLLVVGPMVDQSELPFRLLCRERGAALTYTPMLHARSFRDGAAYRDRYLTTTPVSTVRDALLRARGDAAGEAGGDDPSSSSPSPAPAPPLVDRPLIVQFCANDADVLLDAARWAVRVADGGQPAPGAATARGDDIAGEPLRCGGEHLLYRCDAVDLNLGCPQGIARRGHYGSFLMEDWALVHTLVHTLHVELPVPVTAKIRVFDRPDGAPDEELTLAYMRMLRDAGAQLIAVHGRTRAMKGQLTGLADMALIGRLRARLQADAGGWVPVISNGNVRSAADVARHLRETGCEGHMCAEPLLWDPALFACPARPVPPGRTHGADKPTRLAALATAARYLRWCRRCPVDPGFIKAHLFKMCHHSHELHTDFRDRIGALDTSAEATKGEESTGEVEKESAKCDCAFSAPFSTSAAYEALLTSLEKHITDLTQAEVACDVEGEQPKTAKAEKLAAKAEIQSVFDDEEGFSMDCLF